MTGSTGYTGYTGPCCTGPTGATGYTGATSVAIIPYATNSSVNIFAVPSETLGATGATFVLGFGSSPLLQLQLYLVQAHLL